MLLKILSFSLVDPSGKQNGQLFGQEEGGIEQTITWVH